MGKVSLTCGNIFYRQTSFRMTFVTCSFTVSNKKCFRQQKRADYFRDVHTCKSDGQL